MLASSKKADIEIAAIFEGRFKNIPLKIVSLDVLYCRLKSKTASSLEHMFGNCLVDLKWFKFSCHIGRIYMMVSSSAKSVL